VTTPSGDRLIVHFFTQIFEMIPEIEQFQIRQRTPESITVLYVPAPGCTDSVLGRVRSQILQHCRFPLKVDFRAVEEIPLEKSNKRRFVISAVPFR
jgi:phenylacetate-CoA ligase